MPVVSIRKIGDLVFFMGLVSKVKMECSILLERVERQEGCSFSDSLAGHRF